MVFAIIVAPSTVIPSLSDAVLAVQLALDRAGTFGFPIFCFSPQNIEALSFDKTQHDLEAEVIVDSAANQWLHYGSQAAFNAYF